MSSLLACRTFSNSATITFSGRNGRAIVFQQTRLMASLDRYAACSPTPWILRHNAWQKWKAQPRWWTPGSTLLTADHRADSKSDTTACIAFTAPFWLYIVYTVTSQAATVTSNAATFAFKIAVLLIAIWQRRQMSHSEGLNLVQVIPFHFITHFLQ